MKNNFFKFIIISLGLSIHFVPTFVFAENIAVNTKEMTKESAIQNIIQASSTNIKQIQKEFKIASNTCELVEYLSFNIVDLENKSSTTKIKINDLNKTLEEEIFKKTSIVNTVKNIFTFKKTDKQILEELKTITQKAGDYYEILDTKIIKSKDFYTNFECINIVKENKEDLDQQVKTILNLQKDEDKYRKTFSQSLKDRMKIISKEVENKKEKQKEEKKEDFKTEKTVEKKID